MMWDVPRQEMRTLTETKLFQVECDGRTLWVNSATEGGLLGRFSPMGIDVHTKGTCLACKTGETSFTYFAQLMKQHHDIDVEPYRFALPWLKEVN